MQKMKNKNSLFSHSEFISESIEIKRLKINGILKRVQNDHFFLISSYQFILIMSLIAGCTNKPKVIEAEVAETSSPFAFSDVPDDHKISFETGKEVPSNVFHKVVVEEVLPTSKYVYLKVREGSNDYWIATKKMDVEVGSTYYYRNGLLKTNFESKEYNRTFDQLYLVSSIVPETHGTQPSEKREIEMHAFEGESKTSDSETTGPVLTIAELIKNKESLAGKEVTIQGKCTKVNAKIMGRNWIHLKDGTLDEYDLVITSNSDIPVGHEVIMKGTVSLKKDFGSGYYYELLIEDAKVM